MKDQQSVTIEPIPPLWELEWRVVEIACTCVHEDRSAVTPDAELVADLGLDCLVVVEFLIAVLDASLGKALRQDARAVVDVVLVAPAAVDVDPPQRL